LVVLTVFLRRTIIGLALRAAADDFTMTRLVGIRANIVIAAAFAVSGFMAGVVALFWIGRSGQVWPTVGLQPVLIAFIASVVGGMESLKGAVLGGYVLGFLTMGLQTWLPQGVNNYRDAVMFGIVILVLVIRPQGLVRPLYLREAR
jgi:branched-chain amino acid transport system permease protein